MLQLRQDAASVVQDLRSGLSLTLTYRGRPLARLEPLRPATEEIMASDPLYTLGAMAAIAVGDQKLIAANARLSNADIDHALYGER